MRTLLALAAALVAGCISAEEAFTQGRLEDLCASVVPVCDVQASCVLGPRRFIRSSFPGGKRVVVRAEEPEAVLVVRIFFTEMLYPGTELLLRAYDPRCADFEEERVVDRDFFDLAGDDGILEFALDLYETGDHLLELTSDMSAGYMLTVDIE